MPASTCPETTGQEGQPLACSTAWNKYGCRCDTCREWNKAGRPTRESGDGRTTALTLQRDAAIERIGADAVYGMVASGRSLREIAETLGLPSDHKSRWAISQWITRDTERYDEARAASVDALAERAGEVYGETRPVDSADAKWRNDRSGYFRWLAEIRAIGFGDRNGVTVKVDIGQLHLDALRSAGRQELNPDRVEVEEADYEIEETPAELEYRRSRKLDD